MTRALPAGSVPSAGRPGRLRGRPNRRVLAAALLVVSLAPSMLPRPPWVQALESLLLVAGGWWLGRRGPRCPAWSAVALVVVLLAELAWQALLWLRTAAGLPGALVPLALLVTGGGVLLLRGAPSPRGVARLGIEVVAGVLAVDLVVASVPSLPSLPPVPSVPSIPSIPPLARTERPVHVTVPVGAAVEPARRADLAVTELARAGGLARPTIVVLAPTGSGWVDPAALATLDDVTGGDVATVSVGYDDAPSWLSYATAQDEAVATTRAALDRVRRAVGHDRRVLVYGQSLGALAASRALAPGVADGALWVGPPPGTLATPGAVVLTHASDPVPVWSPALLFRPPPAASDTDLPRPPWLPVVSFLQTSVDLLVALSVPPGHGHRYGAEHRAAWSALPGHPFRSTPGAA